MGIGIRAEGETPKDGVALGDLGYWPPGSAFCIFFGGGGTTVRLERQDRGTR
jgi:hypothetical protein